MATVVSIDFYTFPTATFRILFVLVILSHNRRQIVLFNMTPGSTAKWTAQQIIVAFPWDTAPIHLLIDLAGIYGTIFRRRLENMGIKTENKVGFRPVALILMAERRRSFT